MYGWNDCLVSGCPFVCETGHVERKIVDKFGSFMNFENIASSNRYRQVAVHTYQNIKISWKWQTCNGLAHNCLICVNERKMKAKIP